MDSLTSNFATALSAKDNIIEEKLKEIDELKKLVEQLKKEKESEFRDKTELQIKLDEIVTNANQDVSQDINQTNEQIFSYAEEGHDLDDYGIRRSRRRKRRPKKLIDVSVEPKVVSISTPIANNGQPRRRGRPRLKPLEAKVEIEEIVEYESKDIIAEEIVESSVEISTVDEVLVTDSVSPIVRRKFPHHCDWPGCERSFRRPAFLRKHKRVHTGEKPFKCQYDGCTFASADIFCLRTHEMRHTGEKPYKCKIPGCGWSGRQQTSYDRHRRVIHGNQRIFQCDWPGCDRRYRDKHSLNYHRKSHTGEKEFMCSFVNCGKRFIGRSDMKKHESTHNAVKPYKCSWPGCGRSFVQKRYLALHNLKHTGERPYPCDWPGCEWRSFTPHEQAKHKKTHTGERPYPCERCERRFADESNLKAHLRTVHDGQKNHQCHYPGCGKKYTVRRTLLIHQMKAHPNMSTVITGHTLTIPVTTIAPITGLLELDDSEAQEIQTIIVTTDE